VLNIILDSGLTREFTLTFPDPLRLATWKSSLDGTPPAEIRSGIMGSQDDEESIRQPFEDDRSHLLRQNYDDDRSYKNNQYRGRMSDTASNSSAERRSSFATTNFTSPTTHFTSEFNPVTPRHGNGKPVMQRAAIDAVIVVSVAASMHGLKLQILKDALKFISKNLGDYDRMALVVFGGSSGPEVIAGMTRKSIPVWEKAIDALETGPRGVKAEVIEGVNLGTHL
jgi:Mg-chelatase subunit ChlD